MHKGSPREHLTRNFAIANPTCYRYINFVCQTNDC